LPHFATLVLFAKFKKIANTDFICVGMALFSELPMSDVLKRSGILCKERKKTAAFSRSRLHNND